VNKAAPAKLKPSHPTREGMICVIFTSAFNKGNSLLYFGFTMVFSLFLLWLRPSLDIPPAGFFLAIHLGFFSTLLSEIKIFVIDIVLIVGWFNGHAHLWWELEDMDARMISKATQDRSQHHTYRPTC
jgi:hypothetical protein